MLTLSFALTPPTNQNRESLLPCLKVHYDEFIPMFEEQNPQYPWKEVEVSDNISLKCKRNLLRNKELILISNSRNIGVVSVPRL